MARKIDLSRTAVSIGAGSYPTQIACWKRAPALARGNTMVFERSDTTSLSVLDFDTETEVLTPTLVKAPF